LRQVESVGDGIKLLAEPFRLLGIAYEAKTLDLPFRPISGLAQGQCGDVACSKPGTAAVIQKNVESASAFQLPAAGNLGGKRGWRT
jgi:hypothetical protein